MTTMREKWTDERLDDLNHRVDLGFESVDRRFDSVDRRFDRMDSRFDSLESRLDARFDSMQRTMLHGVIAMTGGMLAGFAAIIVLISAQL
jgi:hypothetical protein